MAIKKVIFFLFIKTLARILLKKTLFRENVIFKEVAEITTTSSKWLIAMLLDWHPYFDSTNPRTTI